MEFEKAFNLQIPMKMPRRSDGRDAINYIKSRAHKFTTDEIYERQS